MQTCRLCNKHVKQFLNLGDMPLPEEFRSKGSLSNPVRRYPVGLSYCPSCHHVQLSNIVSVDLIYKKNYFYDYSVTQSGKSHWQNLSSEIVQKFRLTKYDLVVDIGSNTGTLLSIFKTQGFRILGVDPAQKLASIAKRNEIPTKVGYFTPSLARRIVKKWGNATVITATNVFDHVESLHEFVSAVTILLSPNGTFIIEVPYVPRMLLHHMHMPYLQQIDYMMITPLIPFFNAHNLKIIDAREISIHGGSVRLTVSWREKKPMTPRLMKLIAAEQKLLKNYPEKLVAYAKDVRIQIHALSNWVHLKKALGKHIAAVGASAKGITLLHYAGLGSNDIDFITEKSPLKIDRFTPTGIPIVSDATLLKQQPDYAIILAWNFIAEVKKNLKAFTKTWVVPIPKLREV